MANIIVSTVRQTIVDKKSHVEVFTGARAKKGADGKKVEIAAENRVRSIIINHPDVSAVPSKFSVFVSACLLDVARNQLATLWEADSSIKEVEEGLFTTDGLLTFAAREAESKRLTGESIKLAIAKFLLTLPEARRADAQEIMVSMSASAKKGSEVGCKSLGEKLATWADKQVEGTDDEPNAVLVAVAAKLTARAEELRVQREAFTVDAGF